MIETYIKTSFLLMIAGASSATIVFLLLLFLQQSIFKRKLDHILFNDKYFNQYELSIFSSFPLSLMKTLAYQRAIVFPSTMKQRFHNHSVRNLVNQFDILVSTLSLGILFLCVLIVANLFIAGALNYVYF